MATKMYRWTEEEIKLLKMFQGEKTAEELSKILKKSSGIQRTPAAIRARMSMLGLRSKSQSYPLGTATLYEKEGTVFWREKTEKGWRTVHLRRWEEMNGPLPPGYCLEAVDGNYLNTDPGNYKLVPRSKMIEKAQKKHDQEAATFGIVKHNHGFIGAILRGYT